MMTDSADSRADRVRAIDIPLRLPGELTVTPTNSADRDRDRSERVEREPLYPVIKCPVHLVPEPCPTCSAYIAAGL
jgi:hypothetical protein